MFNTAGMGSPMTTIIFNADLHRIGSVRHQGLQLACNHVQRVNQFDDPDALALAFIFLFTIGGLTGLHLGTLATDMHLTTLISWSPTSIT